MRLETARLIMRTPEPGDVDAYYEFNSDPETMRYSWEPEWKDRKHAEDRVAALQASFKSGHAVPLTISLKGSEVVVGMCGLFNFAGDSRRAEIGYVIARPYWRRGLGFESVQALLDYGFQKLNLNRIEADINPENVASLKLVTKLGFKLEGTIRERWIINGSVRDTSLYGLLRREWQAVKRLRRRTAKGDWPGGQVASRDATLD